VIFLISGRRRGPAPSDAEQPDDSAVVLLIPPPCVDRCATSQIAEDFAITQSSPSWRHRIVEQA